MYFSYNERHGREQTLAQISIIFFKTVSSLKDSHRHHLSSFEDPETYI